MFPYFRVSRLILLSAPLFSTRALAADYFVSTTGEDTNPGTLEKPFASVQHAQSAVKPGDTVYIRGGTYVLKESQIARKQRIWAYVTYLDKSGEKDKSIRYFAYQDEKPIFDLSQVKAEGVRIDAFFVTGSWIHIRGLEVIGVQVTMKGHTQSICFENDGSNNIYERLSMHDSQAIGYYSTRGSDNLVLNCDAYRNWDYTSETGKGGNVDGFGCHPAKGSTGNVFRGCRAWLNSDDGFDCINSHESVTFENCWAFDNGWSAKHESLGDGNGFKAGGYGTTPVTRLPDRIPRHVVRFCVAVGNKANGFYANHHIGGGDWLNNTGYQNNINFNMNCRQNDNKTDIDGYGHKLLNNLSYKPRSKFDINKVDAAKSELANNSFDLRLGLSERDFAGLDQAELQSPRQADGALPKMKFLHPAAGGAIPKGIGAFE